MSKSHDVHSKPPRTNIVPRKKKTHCKQGHLLSPDNVYPRKDGRPTRECLTCYKLRATRKNIKVESKLCQQCNTLKPAAEFHPFRRSKDGYKSECAECHKAYQKFYYLGNVEKVVARHKRYSTTERGKEVLRETRKRQIAKYPEKHRARVLFRNAVAAGKIERRTTCEDCGVEGRIHGHHEDYSKPYDVRWLCVRCHTKAHGRLVNV